MSEQLKLFLDTVYGKPALHPHQRQIIEALTERPMLQSKLFYLFNGRLKKSRPILILESLVSAGLITSTHEKSGGRPRTVWSMLVSGVPQHQEQRADRAERECRWSGQHH
jgi:hypothetical protein